MKKILLAVATLVLLAAGASVGYYFYSIRKSQGQTPTAADTFQNPFTGQTTKPQSSFGSAPGPSPTFANPFATTPTTYQNPFGSTGSGEEPYQNPFEKLR